MNTSSSSPTPSNAAEPLPLRAPLTLLLVFTLLTGIVYPLLVTGLAQALFPQAANGRLIERDGRVVGSEWIGQSFSAPGYFWGRPSATDPVPYDASHSGGSNLGPNHPALHQAVAARVAALQAADPGASAPVPVDLVTASASGLDPHISPAAAEFQVARVARARGLSQTQVRALVARHTEWPWLGVLGEPRVHVLRLNLDLDATGAR